jgi:DNA-binding beta-propeller fold protein YncE
MAIAKRPSFYFKLAFLFLGLVMLVGAFLIYRYGYKKKIPTNRYAIGAVTTLAGAGYTGVENGQAKQAVFSDPFGVAVDSDGNVIIADAGECNCIRKITPKGVVEIVAGSGEGFADGKAQEAKFNTPSAIAIDDDDNLIIADTTNNRIRKLDKKGNVTTIAGSGAIGLKDGKANEAAFDSPVGVAVDEEDNIYVADTYNDSIRKIDKAGNVTTIAGTGAPGYQDGEAHAAMFDTPSGIAVDKQGNIFVADTGNRAIRKITKQGEVTTIAGDSKDSGADETVRDLHYYQPVGLALTHDGFLFVTDANGLVSRITPEGDIAPYSGWRSGFADGKGAEARFNAPAGIAVDDAGNLYVTDSQSYLIRKIAPVISGQSENYFAANAPKEKFIQPLQNDGAKTNGKQADAILPRLDKEVLKINTPFPYPLSPQNQWHEFAGVVGEVRGWFNGEARDHLHSGLDVVGKMGESCLSVIQEKVSAPISNWGYNETGEGLHVGLMSYIHIRVGRNQQDQIQVGEKFKPRVDASGKLIGVRVRRGTRFRVGDVLGTLNRLNHVHMNFGPRNSEANAIALPFYDFKDTVAPIIEPNGIEITSLDGKPFKEKQQGRLVITGDVAINATSYDRVDGNGPTRKLGLYRVGYQLLTETGAPVKGFEQPLINIEFNRLAVDDTTKKAVEIIYAEGSGISAYGTPTKFKYVVTSYARDGEVREGFLRTSLLAPGHYLVKVIAEDYSGNRAAGKETELAITIK